MLENDLMTLVKVKVIKKEIHYIRSAIILHVWKMIGVSSDIFSSKFIEKKNLSLRIEIKVRFLLSQFWVFFLF